MACREFNGVESFAERSNLVHLDENTVCNFAVDTHLQASRICYEEIVAHELDALAQ